jgi:hypothetical protein
VQTGQTSNTCFVGTNRLGFISLWSLVYSHQREVNFASTRNLVHLYYLQNICKSQCWAETLGLQIFLSLPTDKCGCTNLGHLHKGHRPQPQGISLIAFSFLVRTIKGGTCREMFISTFPFCKTLPHSNTNLGSVFELMRQGCWWESCLNVNLCISWDSCNSYVHRDRHLPACISISLILCLFMSNVF